MQSIRSFLDAVEAFGARLAAVDLALLAAAIAFSVGNLVLRARAWQGILRAAFPGTRIRYRTAFGAYCGGVGVNAAIPARAGDLVKMLLVKRSVPSTSYPSLAGTLVAETVFDFVVASALLLWALQTGVLPGLPSLPQIPAFDLAWAFRNPIPALVIVAGVIALVIVLGRRVRAFWRRFGLGLVILRTPLRYLRSVVSYQALGWGCRIGGAYFFLEAFGVPGSLANALVVQVASTLGTLFPATPSGLGPKQALLVVMLAGSAGRTQVLAFSVGMELTMIAVNATLGLTSMAVMLRNVRFREAIRHARSQRARGEPGGEPAGPTPGPGGEPAGPTPGPGGPAPPGSGSRGRRR